jgi:hypothetical protein
MKVVFNTMLGICAALILSQGVARASDPVGVYALIDKATFEPNGDAPERIQLFGVFAVHERDNPNTYQAPQRGYLYFTLPATKESVARKEWADLKAMAGKRQVIAFGSRYELRATVRKTGDKPASPDVYTLSLGVVKVRTDTDYGPVKSLLEFASH